MAGARSPLTVAFPLQLDREHRVAGIFPYPTFKDKSTYIESSTKVYDDVSDPHGPVVVSKHPYSPGTGWPLALSARTPVRPMSHPVCPACRIYFLAKSRVLRATWKFP